MIKLVAIDLDGTLFDSKKRITQENKDAIKKAKENGIKVVLATGRPYNGIKKTLEELNLIDDDDYVICYNGARIFKTKSLEPIASSFITYDEMIKVYEEAIRQNSYFHVFTEKEKLLTSKFNPYTEIESTINGVEANEANFYEIPNYTKFIKAMIVDDEKNLDRIINNISSDLPRNFQMVRSSKIFLEFLNKYSNKGFALETLSKYLGLNPDELMAIGDAGNDIAMIKYAGTGVAMKNSFPEVKIIANYITENDNENSGVAEAFNNFCF